MPSLRQPSKQRERSSSPKDTTAVDVPHNRRICVYVVRSHHRVLIHVDVPRTNSLIFILFWRYSVAWLLFDGILVIVRDRRGIETRRLLWTCKVQKKGRERQIRQMLFHCWAASSSTSHMAVVEGKVQGSMT